MHDPNFILSVLDGCCDALSFPMLDNGYVYLAATRLSLFRSHLDWAIVFEVFGFSPREGIPSTTIQTFASRLNARNTRDSYVNLEAYQNYLSNHPHDEFRSVWPMDDGPGRDPENEEFVGDWVTEVVVRNRTVELPPSGQYYACGVELEESPRVQVFELCRYLADIARDDVLATPDERRVSIFPNMNQILQLEEWHHPDVTDRAQRPSTSETFRQLALILATGDVRHYRPSQPPNTHWRNWPDGGSL